MEKIKAGRERVERTSPKEENIKKENRSPRVNPPGLEREAEVSIPMSGGNGIMTIPLSTDKLVFMEKLKPSAIVFVGTTPINTTMH